MDNNRLNHINTHSENAVAYPRSEYNYGYASSVEYAEPLTYEAAPSLSFSEYISYFLNEYFKGFLFIFLTSVFILAIPKKITEQGSLKVTLYSFLKRGMDIFGAVVGMILTSPVWLLLPIIIKLDSRGPVFYSQTRVGVDRRKLDRRSYQKADSSERRNRDRRRDDYCGQTFEVYKFRTMVQDAEKQSGPVWATKNDPRITRLGNFMRKTRLDEIPQFLNVLKGDMSLVGPRPERPKFVVELSGKIDGYTDRLQVKPGITGLAQVENGYDDSLASVVQKVKHDVNYINNRSLWLDIKILLKTVKVVFTGKGAH